MNVSHTKNGRFGIIHGQYDTTEYKIWAGMIQRCTNPSSINWNNYGGRGITVCEQWRNYETFRNDIGPRPSTRHSLERIDNNRGYSKDNCRWATRSEQSRNTSLTIFITFNNETKSITDWAESLKIKPNTLYYRIKKYHWTVERALTTRPIR